MNYKFLLSHPASAVYNKGQKWDSKNIFNDVQKILKDNYNFSGLNIFWSLSQTTSISVGSELLVILIICLSRLL